MAESTSVPTDADRTRKSLDPDTLKEYEPLTDLLSQIPKKVQRGLQTQTETLEITCIDANSDFIALGSNIGIVFLYDRSKHTIERLRSDDRNAHVSSVQLHCGLDHLVAIGYLSGDVYMFQLPSMMIGHSKQLERFVVHDLHTSPVRCLAWSTNGMKLFSGDSKGSVGCTEVDFYEGQCKSSILLIENDTEIVQLDMAHKSLLVSTLHRCIICRLSNKDQMVQVGSKDRKIIDEFGAVFIPAMCKPEDAQLFCARPGFRIWKASIDGTVNNTFMFKDLLSQPHNQITVGAFVVTSIEKGVPATQFGPLLLFHGNYLVTWNQSCLYVLNPEESAIIGTQKNLGKIKCVVTTGNELFVLRGNTNRDLIRIATTSLPQTGSKILRELQEEKEKRQSRDLKEEKDDKCSSKNSSTESLQEKQKDKKSSPFKFLQENLVEKIKKIPKPNEIKEKIQEKINRDSQEESRSSKYNQEYVFETEQDCNKENQTDLPPVIKLDSPDLLSIEVAIDAIKMGEKDKASMKKRPSVEQFAALVDTQSDEIDAELLSNQSTSKTASGAHSALRKLQEEHNEEENSDTVLSRKSFSEDSLELTTSVELSQERKNEKQTAKESFPLERIKVVIPEEEGIVFSRKIKSKGKKKKATKESKSSPKLEIDQDRVSVTSFTSNSSETNETTLDTTISDGTADDNARTEDGHLLQDETDVKLPEVNEKVNQKENIGLDEAPSNMESGSSVQSNLQNFTIEDLNKANGDTEQIGVKVHNSALIHKGDEISNCEATVRDTIQTVDISNNSAKTAIKQDKFETEMEGKPNLDDQKEVQEVSDKEDKFPTVNPSSEPLVEGYSALSTQDDSSDSGTASNLDKEIARLNSYLSQSSESGFSDFEGPKSLSSSIQARKEAETILLKGSSQRYRDLEDEITRNYGKNLQEYKESDLDKQLKQLDFEATCSNLGTAKSPVFSPEISPSIYTLYKTPSVSQDDFYSNCTPKSTESLSSTSSFNFPVDRKTSEYMSESIHVLDTPQSLSAGKSVNMWTEISAQGNMLSLCASSTHMWYTDKSSNIWYSALTGPGLTWRKASGYASQIAVSPLGNIVWRLYKGVAYAGTKITAKCPEGLKWVQSVQGDVAYICVDETCAWYIKTSYEVMIQKELSRDRPCYTAKPVDCPFKLKQIVCQSGVVWGLTEEFQWIYREDVTKTCPEGTCWKKGASGSDDRLFTCLSLGDGNIGWAIDVLGTMWFICGVTMEKPQGDGIWWQVPPSGEYLMKDATTMDMLKAFTKKLDPQNLAYILHHQRGGLVCGRSGVWFCPEYKHLLHVCRGSIEGHYWGEAQPEGLSSTLVWKIVEARTVRSDKGLLWIQQGSGDIFTYTPDRQNCGSVQSPNPGSIFVCISACPDAVWVLLDTGAVYIRTGIGPIYPQGGGWYKLDLTQIDFTHFVHISCGNSNVWAVDNEGGAYQRIGVKAPNDHSLNAAWLPVDNGGTVFTHIIAGPQDWMVWAIDNRRQVYVRSKITPHMPIGRQWIHVPGTLACQLALSDHYVWALNPSGELLCRYGVTIENVTGDYWKKFPGVFASITVSPNNQLWGINKEGQLLRRHTKYIIKDTGELEKGRAGSGRGISTGSDDLDWELV